MVIKIMKNIEAIESDDTSSDFEDEYESEDDVYSLGEFMDQIKNNWLIDYDGHANILDKNGFTMINPREDYPFLVLRKY